MNDVSDALTLATVRRLCGELTGAVKKVDSLQQSEADACVALIDELRTMVERNVLGEEKPSADHYLTRGPLATGYRKSRYADR